MSYYEKYLKYKNKYNQLKGNMIGGGYNTTVKLFKAEWCGHCQSFKNTWENLQKEGLENVNFVTYDANTHKEEIKQHNINGYPTIMINNSEYNGKRDLHNIKKAIMKLTV